MTIKLPPRGQRSGPIYQAIADAIGREIEAGRLKPGGRLPTQRVLARQLGVTLTTVTRAYVEAQRRGLLSGEVGRGTFVRPERAGDRRTGAGSARSRRQRADAASLYGGARRSSCRSGSAIGRRADLRVSESCGCPAQSRRGVGVDRLGRSRCADRSHRRHRRRPARDSAVADGAGEAGRRNSRRRVHLPRDYRPRRPSAPCGCGPSRSIAKALCPSRSTRRCRAGMPTALYCISSFQNPTAAFMSDERRRQIAKIAIKHRLTVIEDDVFGFLAPEVKPLSSYLPEDQFFYITSTAKSIAPGMRIGYLLAPASAIERLSISVLRTMVNAPPAMAELATSLITDGVAGRITEWKRKEIAERQAIATRVLAGLDVQTQPKKPSSVGAPARAVADRRICRARAAPRHSAEQRRVVRGRARDRRAGGAHYAWSAFDPLRARGRACGNRQDAEARSGGLRAGRLN